MGALVAATASALRPPRVAPAAQVLTLWNVTVANPGEAPLAGQTVVANGGVIESIQPSLAFERDLHRVGNESNAAFARRLELAHRYAGAWVTPGLVDTASAYPPEWSGLRGYLDLLFLEFGVTTVHLPWTPDVARRAQAIAAGSLAGPRLLPLLQPVAVRGPALEPDGYLVPAHLWPLLGGVDAPVTPGKSAWQRLAFDAAATGPDAAWAAATRSGEGGTVRSGGPADLLVLRRNPLDGSGGHADLELVVSDGRAYSRRRLDEAVIAYMHYVDGPAYRGLARIAARWRRR